MNRTPNDALLYSQHVQYEPAAAIRHVYPELVSAEPPSDVVSASKVSRYGLDIVPLRWELVYAARERRLPEWAVVYVHPNNSKPTWGIKRDHFAVMARKALSVRKAKYERALAAVNEKLAELERVEPA